MKSDISGRSSLWPDSKQKGIKKGLDCTFTNTLPANQDDLKLQAMLQHFVSLPCRAFRNEF